MTQKRVIARGKTGELLHPELYKGLPFTRTWHLLFEPSGSVCTTEEGDLVIACSIPGICPYVIDPVHYLAKPLVRH